MDQPMRPAASEALVDPVFEIRVAGLVPAETLRQLGDTPMTAQELRTVLTGRFVDQAELYGFLARLRSLGLDIIEVRRVPFGAPDETGVEGS